MKLEFIINKTIRTKFVWIPSWTTLGCALNRALACLNHAENRKHWNCLFTNRKNTNINISKACPALSTFSISIMSLRPGQCRYWSEVRWGEVRWGEVRYLCWGDPGWCWLKHISLPGHGLTGLGSPAAPSLSWLSSEFKYISKCELSNHSAFSQRGPCQHTPASRLLLTLSLTRYRLSTKTCQTVATSISCGNDKYFALPSQSQGGNEL